MAKSDLLSRIERYIAHAPKAKEMTPTKFGRLALNDPSLVTDLKRGRSVSLRTEARIVAFMKGAAT